MIYFLVTFEFLQQIYKVKQRGLLARSKMALIYPEGKRLVPVL